MVSKRAGKVSVARKQLERAITSYKAASSKDERELFFLALVKALEVLVEYCWKRMKATVEDEGLEAASPKEAVRQAATLGHISDPERWIAIIGARNLSVHDYFGVSEGDYVKLAQELVQLVSAFEA